MALFFTLDAGDDRRRWYITRGEAEAALSALRAAGGGGANPGGAAAGEVGLARGARGLIREEQVDELVMRQWAANWANASEAKRVAAKKREAAKTPEQRSQIMKKAWEKRKAKQS